jgi:AcrR family transcriptional regulator
LSDKAAQGEGEQRTDKRRATGSRTRQRIVNAAEALFAQKGYEAVALRDIIREAGVNSAAIHYHFGTKEALLIHILRSRGAPIAEKRMENLAQLRARGPIVLSELLDAFFRPAVYEERGGKSVRSTYADIRIRLWLEDEKSVRAVQSEIFDQSTRAYLQAMQECLPHLSERDIYFRFDFILGLMVHTMTNSGRIRELSFGTADPSDPEVVMRHLIPFVEAGLRGGSNEPGGAEPAPNA